MEIQVKKSEYPGLFSWSELEILINIRPLMNSDRVHIVEGGMYSWYNDCWTKDKNCYPPSLLRGLLDSHLCYFSDMSRCTEKINNLAYEIETEYNSSCDAHIYVCRNPNLKHPFGIHYDFSHNVIVQCEGVTNFKVWDMIVDNPNGIRTNLPIEKPPYLDVILNPGDAIYIPAYAPHLADSKTSRLSVSFPFHPEESDYFQDRTWVKL
jgi:hypothetical protein